MTTVAPARRALITGASSGIGAAMARLLASEGYDLVITARREPRLKALAAELTNQYGVAVTPIARDLSKTNAAQRLFDALNEQELTIDVLVNNAGFGGSDSFLATDWGKLNTELQLMVVAKTQLIHLIAPGMVERGWGRIINVASVAGYVPVMKGLLYSGTKSYLVNVSQALDMAMHSKGVHVTALCPGLTETEFFDVQGSRTAADRMPSFVKQSAEEVARIGYDAVMAGKPVVVPGLVNKAMVSLSRITPEAVRYQLGKRFEFL